MLPFLAVYCSRSPLLLSHFYLFFFHPFSLPPPTSFFLLNIAFLATLSFLLFLVFYSFFLLIIFVPLSHFSNLSLFDPSYPTQNLFLFFLLFSHIFPSLSLSLLPTSFHLILSYAPLSTTPPPTILPPSLLPSLPLQHPWTPNRAIRTGLRVSLGISSLGSSRFLFGLLIISLLNTNLATGRF